MGRLFLIALIGSAAAIELRAVRQEYAILLGSATAAILLVEVLFRLTGLSDAFGRMLDEYGVSKDALGVVLKILGIAYLTDLGVNIAKDAGQHAIAGALETGGRVLILSCALPAVISLFETGVSLMRGTVQ